MLLRYVEHNFLPSFRIGNKNYNFYFGFWPVSGRLGARDPLQRVGLVSDKIPKLSPYRWHQADTVPRRRRPRTNLKKVVRAVTAVQPAAAPLNCDVRPGHKGVGPKSREEAQGNENQKHRPTFPTA